MKIDTLRDFYVHELQDLFSAENQLVKAIPKMIKKTTSPDLQAALEAHLEETRVHIERLETIFESLDASAKGTPCKAMEGLLAEADEILKDAMPDNVKDAALIAAAQRVEHYEIAGYGCARTYAKILGESDAESLLDQSLQEEGAADKKLTKIAEASVNEDALSGASKA